MGYQCQKLALNSEQPALMNMLYLLSNLVILDLTYAKYSTVAARFHLATFLNILKIFIVFHEIFVGSDLNLIKKKWQNNK